jgi:ABC-type branched-subunit amino acid transport system substrate-binding protein
MAFGSGALIVLAAISGCGSSGTGGGGSSSGGKVVIGDADDLTGDISLYGQWTLAYLRSAINYVNKHGGVGGKQIELETVDAAASGQTISSAAQQLLNEHATMMFGSTESSDCDALVSTVTSHQVPIICTSVESKDVSPTQPYVFAGGISEAQEAPATVQFLKNSLKIPAGAKVAVINADSAGAQFYGQTIVPDLTAAGYKVITHQQTGSAGLQVGGATLANVVSSHPAAVVADMGAADGETLFNQLHAQGQNVPLIMANAQIGPTIFDTVKDPNLYGIDVAQPITDLSTSATGAALALSVLKAGGQTTLDQVNQAVGTQDFAPVWDAIQALKKCGGCSGAALDKALQEQSVALPGLIAGNFEWTTSSHVGYTECFLVHYDPSTQNAAVFGNASPLASP